MKDPRLQSAKGFFLFAIITISIHICFRFWTGTLNYFPVPVLWQNATVFMENMVFHQAKWVMANILGMSVTTTELTIWFPTKWGIIISEGCTGLKQVIQVLFLFLIFPGPWKHKVWFIPAGIIIIHITNVIRIVLLGIAMNMNLPGIHFIHNNVLRIFFYIVIFGMWLVWVEKIVPGGRKDGNQNPV